MYQFIIECTYKIKGKLQVFIIEYGDIKEKSFSGFIC